MTWQIVVAMFIVVPVILLPVALVWWLNSGHIYRAIKGLKEKQVTHQQPEQEVTVPQGQK